MKWFGKHSAKGKRGKKKPLRRLPKKPLAPVEEIVEQGLLVADVAVRMHVKNAIIINALKRNVDYHPDEIERLTREHALELAEERERDAKHIRRVRDEVRQYGRSSWRETEYGNDDNRTLRHRQEVYEGLSEELRARAADDAYVQRLAEQAREAAWREIGDSLKDRAEHPYYGGGSTPEYRRERDARIQLLIERDLTDLMREHTRKPKKTKDGGLLRRGGPKKDSSDAPRE